MTVQVHSNTKESAFAAREAKLLQFDPSNIAPPIPPTALIELSNWCNHACIFCTNPRMQRKKGFLDIQVYERFLDQAIPEGLKEVGLYTTGEPFFTKNLDEYVRLARQKGATYVYITSNGALATPDRIVSVLDAGLTSIKFSINAGSRETYKLVHGKDDFDKVIEHLKFVSDYRKKKNLNLKIFASSVVTRFVEPEKDKIKELLLPLVDDLAFYAVGPQGGQSLEQFALLESSMPVVMPELGKAPPCFMLWNRLHLTWEGYLTLCCVDYEDALTFADLRQTTVKEAWNNQVIRTMRKRHLSQELDGTLCKNCLYGTKDAVHPLTAIGHADTDRTILSQEEKGVQSVINRISSLQNLSQK